MAVITAVPIALAVTRPFALTEATLALLEDHVTDLSVALAGKTVAVKALVSPTIKLALLAFKEMLSTATVPYGLFV